MTAHELGIFLAGAATGGGLFGLAVGLAIYLIFRAVGRSIVGLK
jgi:hypothetical protein